MNGRERVLATLAGQAADRIPLMPITMMFAARQTGVRYGDYARDHRVLAEAQVATAEKFGFDYVSAISDPAREAADLGAAVQWFDDQPPAIDETRALLHDKAALARLRPADPHTGPRMSDRIRGVELLRRRVGGDLLVEGWVEGPCAEAADLRGINTLMTDFSDDPGFVRDLFAFAAGMGLGFARAQIEAGADIIGVGDAAASLVGPAIYNEFVLPFERQLVDGIHAAGGRVRLHICGRTRRIFAGMGSLGCELVDLDWMAPVAEARAAMGPDQALLGNVDPVAVLRAGTPDSIREAARACRDAAGPRWVAGAGCEVVRDTPEENLRAFCGIVHG